MNAKKILKTLDYLPRWAWYLASLFIVGLLGPLVVYLVFHVLTKIAKEQESAAREAAYEAARRSSEAHKEPEYVVTSDEEIERRWQQTQQSAARVPESEPSLTEDADVNEVIRAGQDAMRRIRHANDVIRDPDLSSQIDSIEASCAQILSILRQRPQLLSQLRTFLRYYLPTTLKLLDARAKLEDSAKTPKALEVRTRIGEAVGAIDKAFLKEVEALDAYRFIDLESEMDVLRDMLRADGLIDEEQGDDPFAGVMGGH